MQPNHFQNQSFQTPSLNKHTPLNQFGSPLTPQPMFQVQKELQQNSKDQKLEHNQFYDNQNELFQESTLSKFSNQSSDQHFTSVHLLSEYLQFVWNVSNASLIDNLYQFSKNQIQQSHLPLKIHEKLINSKLFEKCPNFTSKILIHSIQTTKYSEIVVIWYQLGYYKLKIVILNRSTTENECSPFHYLQKIANFGSFGDIYKVLYNHELYAVKCIRRSSDHNSKQPLQQRRLFFAEIMKQYFFLTFFSALQIGPKNKKLFGFDIIFSHHCAEFSMELCTQLKMKSNWTEKIKQNMKIMHCLKIVHRDIKPDNLMWSNQFNSPVFIDFGGSEFLLEEIGTQTKTKFVGTIGFISDEIKGLLGLKIGYVDLYYNDSYGLKMSMHEMAVRYSFQQFPDQSAKIDLAKRQQFLIIQIKYKLYKKQFDSQFLDLLKKVRKWCYESDNVDQMILDFMIELFPCDNLRKVYWLMSGQVRDLAKFQKLKDSYKDELSYIFATWHHFPFKQHKFSNQIKLQKNLHISFGKLTEIEIRILKILESKNTIQSFFNTKNSEFSSQQNLMVFCIVSILSCSFTKDKFGFTVHQKLFLIQKIISIVFHQIDLENNQITQNLKSITHDLILKQFKSWVTFLQFFLARLWKIVPQKFEIQVLKNIIGTLSLVGYPFYIFQVKQLIIFYALQLQNSLQSFNEKFKRITFFWKIQSLIVAYRMTFFGRKKLSCSFENQIVTLKIMEKVFKSEEQLINDDTSVSLSIPQQKIIWIHTRFYRLYRKQKSIFDEGYRPKQLFKDLNDKSLVESMSVQSKKHYNQWRQGILLCQYLLPGRILNKAYLNSNQTQVIKIQLDDNTDCTINFTTFLEHCRLTGNMWRLCKMLKIVDEEIVLPDFSCRMFIDLRIYAAWIERDNKSLKKFVEIIVTEIQSYSEQNLYWLSKITKTIKSIMVFERHKFWFQGMWKTFGFWQIQKLINKVIQYLGIYVNQDEFKIETHKQILNLLENSPLRSYKLLKNINLEHISMSSSIPLRKLAALFKGIENCFQSFYLIKQILRKMAEIIRLSDNFIRQGLYMENMLPCIDQEMFQSKGLTNPITYIRQRVPEVLTKIIVISPQIHRELREQLVRLTIQLDRQDLIFHILMEQNWMLTREQILYFHEQIQFRRQTIVDSIENVYGGPLDQIQFSNSKFLNNPTPTTLSIYYNFKIYRSTELNVKYYSGLIEAYKAWLKEQSFQLFYEAYLLKNIFNAYIYCQKPFWDFLKFLLHLTDVLRQAKEHFAVDILVEAIRDKFWCMCDQCFKIKPKNWKPLEFITYVDSKLDEISEIENPYFALILHSMSFNPYLPYKVKRRFVVFVVKSLQYLSIEGKREIFYRLYEIGYKLKATQKGYFSEFGHWNGEYLGQKAVYPEELIRMEYYYVEKTLKKSDRTFQIKNFIDTRLNIKKLRRPKWKLPQFVEKAYRDKLYRYHFIFDELDDKDYHPEVYERYIEQFLLQISSKQ